MVSSRQRRCITAIRWSPGTSLTLREPVCRSSTCGRDRHGPDAARAMRPPDGADWLCALTIEVATGATMEIPPEEEQGRVQSQHRASRARRPVFEQRAAIVGTTVVVGLVIYLTVTVQDPQARSIFEF